jgi:hypothetical protein
VEWKKTSVAEAMQRMYKQGQWVLPVGEGGCIRHVISAVDVQVLIQGGSLSAFRQSVHEFVCSQRPPTPPVITRRLSFGGSPVNKPQMPKRMQSFPSRSIFSTPKNMEHLSALAIPSSFRLFVANEPTEEKGNSPTSPLSSGDEMEDSPVVAAAASNTAYVFKPETLQDPVLPARHVVRRSSAPSLQMFDDAVLASRLHIRNRHSMELASPINDEDEIEIVSPPPLADKDDGKSSTPALAGEEANGNCDGTRGNGRRMSRAHSTPTPSNSPVLKSRRATLSAACSPTVSGTPTATDDPSARARAESGPNTPDPQYRILLRERRRSVEMPALAHEPLSLSATNDFSETCGIPSPTALPIMGASFAFPELPTAFATVPLISPRSAQSRGDDSGSTALAPAVFAALEQQHQQHQHRLQQHDSKQTRKDLSDTASPTMPLARLVALRNGHRRAGSSTFSFAQPAAATTSSSSPSSPTRAPRSFYNSPTLRPTQPHTPTKKGTIGTAEEPPALSACDIWHQGHTLLPSATVGEVIDKLVTCTGHNAWLVDGQNAVPRARVTPPLVLKLLLPTINRNTPLSNASTATPSSPFQSVLSCMRSPASSLRALGRRQSSATSETLPSPMSIASVAQTGSF